VVAGEDPDSKYDKAQSLGIEILAEEAFLAEHGAEPNAEGQTTAPGRHAGPGVR